MKHNNLLHYTSPAREWTQALPVGNGTLGAMVYGGIKSERIALNHDELWTGKPKDTIKKGAPKSFEKARKLALKGKLIEAQKEIEENFQSVWSQAYLPLGDLNFSFNLKGKVRNYKRYLNLENAISGVEYDCGDTTVKREVFASYPHKFIGIEIAFSKPTNFSFEISSKLRSSSFIAGRLLLLDGECHGDNAPDKKFPDKRYYDEPKLKGIHFRAGANINTDGEVEFQENTVCVFGAKKAEILFTCETSFNGFDKHPYLEGKEYKNACISRLESPEEFGKIKADSVTDYQSIYNRVKLDIKGNGSDLPTDKRLVAFKKSKDDIGLIELVYNFGRFLSICSSRPGSQASNLQGIWNHKYDAPWNSNYTVNINTQMNYWPVLMTNMAELNEPLIDLIKKLSVTGEKTAKGQYGKRGWVSHHNADLWGLSTPVSGSASWAFWHGSSGWFCRHLFEHYEHTLDLDFLKNTAYPIMKGAAEFYVDIMTEENGKMFLCPGTSPENCFTYQGKTIAVSKYATMSMGIAKDLFENCVKTCDILGVDKEFSQELKEILSKFAPFKIGSKGQLLEWDTEHPETDPHHRHCSNLYALHPANLITSDGTPELADACRRTLEIRGDNGTGWSLGWKINFWARLFDGNHALKLIEMQLRPVKSCCFNYGFGGGTYENLFDAHPPFQIDGNFGFVSGITEMLMQSRDGRIYLLPALPDSWKDGSIKGLKAKGNVTVDIAWKDGKVTHYNLEGKGDFVLVYNGKEEKVSL